MSDRRRKIPKPPRISAAHRQALEEEIERLIAILDLVDPDPDLEETGDLEPYLAGSPSSPLDAEMEFEDEPPLGSLDRAVDQRHWSQGNNHAAANECELDRSDVEPSLGSLEGPDQRLWSQGDLRDREVDQADDERDDGNSLGARLGSRPDGTWGLIVERVSDRQVRP